MLQATYSSDIGLCKNNIPLPYNTQGQILVNSQQYMSLLAREKPYSHFLEECNCYMSIELQSKMSMNECHPRNNGGIDY